MLQDSDCNDNFHGNHLGVSSDYQWSIFEMRNEYSTIHAYKWYMSDTYSPYMSIFEKCAELTMITIRNIVICLIQL